MRPLDSWDISADADERVTLTPAPRRSRALNAAVCVPILIAIVGALAARPIADDYSIEGQLVASGGMTQAFRYWMNSWTSLYSTFAVLNAGSSVGHVVGIRIYYPTASLLLLLVIAVSAHIIVRSWTSLTGVQVGTTLAVGALTTAFLGSLASVWHRDPVLFGALYWPALSVSHLVPLPLLVVALAVLLRARPSMRRRGAPLDLCAGLLMGFVIAGFGLAEAAIACVATGASAWALYRLRGRPKLRCSVPCLTGFVTGLVCGFVVVLALPGTSARQQALEHRHAARAIPRAHGMGRILTAAPHALVHNAMYVFLSPAIPIGMICGYLLRRACVPLGDHAEERRVLWIVGIAMAATLVGSWTAVSLGDAASYTAWWHEWPLLFLTTLFAVLVGWALAAATLSSTLRTPVVGLLLVTGLGWSTANVSFAAAATWRRHATFDANVAAANAVRRRDAAPPAVWRSEPVGDIQDLRADVKYWTNTAVADWLRVPADHFRVTVSEGPSATVPLPWLRGHAQQTRSPVRVRTARPAGCAGQCRSPKQ